MASATIRAIALVDAGELCPHAAAIEAGITPGAIYRALARRRQRAAEAPAEAPEGGAE